MDAMITVGVGVAAAVVAGWLTGHRLLLWGDLLLGAAGSVVGRGLFDLAGLPLDGLSGSFLAATSGALAVLSVVRLFDARRTP